MGQGDPNLEEVDRATGVQNSVLDYYNNLLATSQYIGGDVSSAALEIMSKGFKSNFLSILPLLISTTFLGSDSSLCCPSSIRSLRDQTLMLGGNEFQIARLGRLCWPRFLIKWPNQCMSAHWRSMQYRDGHKMQRWTIRYVRILHIYTQVNYAFYRQ